MACTNAFKSTVGLAAAFISFVSDARAGGPFYELFPSPPAEMAQKFAHDRVRPSPGEFWMAIVGDSSVTGAAASPEYKASYFSLGWNIIEYISESRRYSLVPSLSDYPNPQRFNLTSPIEPLTRIMYSTDEFEREASRGEIARVTLNAAAKAGLRLDTPELTFGYMVGRALNVPPSKIVLVGEDGKQVDSIAGQFRRLAEIGTSELPPLVLLSYVANDFCHPDYFTRPVQSFRDEYAKNLARELGQVKQMEANHRFGTRIVVLAPLDVAQLLSSKEIQNQRVPFHRVGEVTCGAIRNKTAAVGPLGQAMQGTLTSECRGVLAKPADMASHLQRIRELQAAQVEVLAEASSAFNTSAGPIHFELARSTRDIVYQTGDVANDCFHPSVHGHARVAAQLLSHELQSLVAERRSSF